MNRNLIVWALLILITLSGCTTEPLKLAIANESHPHSQFEKVSFNQSLAPLLDNLGNHHHPISSQNPLVQHYFNQGLILAYGFNHEEAARSFREAIRLDPNCAICHWGLAYVLGPNINAQMDDAVISEAWQALQKAIALSDKASDREKAYIEALATRYSRQPVSDRSQLDLSYANAMREVARRYPDDLDAATLFAEAVMNTTPWDYWEENGSPKPEGVEILATLESILKRDPNHPGANHLYIHAVEKQRPELGIAAADRLANLVPGAGHLVHMPSHIYIRVGRYQDAVVANQRAVQADQNYSTQCHAQGLYPIGYMPHNHHFLWFAATMAGQQQVATEAAHHTAQMADRQLMEKPGYGTLQHFYAIPLYNGVKFGRWDEILATPAPATNLKYPTGVWHYARGMAFLAKGEVEKAQQELEKLTAIAHDPELETVKIWETNTTANLLKIAKEVLAAEAQTQSGNFEKAIAHLQTAINLEDKLSYDEPASWHSPVRQSLGAVFLKAGRFPEAENIYKEDLAIYPENGWSLQGLAESLRQQGKLQDAELTQQHFETVWRYADLALIQ